MATLYRNAAGVILLRVDQVLDIDNLNYSIVGEDGVCLTELKIAKTVKNLSAIISQQFVVERASELGGNNLKLRITDLNGGVVMTESLYYEPSFFSPHLDYSTSESFPPFSHTAYDKPAQLAVLTHASNEDVFLKIFLDYYSKLTSPENIYIIDHGSTFRSKWLRCRNRSQVIRIPKGKVDHLNIKRYVEYFQRFLLTQYRWVLSVDCDELLVHKDGPRFINKLLVEHDGVSLTPGKGLNLVQNPKMESELDLDLPISDQRNHYELANSYAKPVLSSIPCTWTMGFHGNLSPPGKNLVIENLYLIHLAWVSVAECARRNSLWKNYEHSAADELFVSQSARVNQLSVIEEEMISRCAKENLVDVPISIRGQF